MSSLLNPIPPHSKEWAFPEHGLPSAGQVRHGWACGVRLSRAKKFFMAGVGEKENALPVWQGGRKH